MKENLRSGYHAFPKHDEDDDPERLEQKKNFRTPQRFDARRTLGRSLGKTIVSAKAKAIAKIPMTW